jgi:hypothetical protein
VKDMQTISLKQAAGILAMTQDEVMFLHQSNRMKAGINQDSMNWEFDIDIVLQMKAVLDEEAAEVKKTAEEIGAE